MAIVSAAGLHIPVVVSVRSNPSREYPDKLTRFLVRILFSRTAGVVLQTQQAKAFFPKTVQKKAVILPNSLNKQFLERTYCEQRKKEIVWVGRMDENKNPKLLLEVFIKLADKYPQWSLKYVGGGPLFDDLKTMAGKADLENRVIFTGKIDEVAETVSQASVFVLTSKQEGMPNALIEAMVLGLAAVATDCPCGGPAELIQNGENGILIPVDDAVSLERALIRLMEDDMYRERIAENAKKLIETVHPDHVNQMWLNYIESTKCR